MCKLQCCTQAWRWQNVPVFEIKCWFTGNLGDLLWKNGVEVQSSVWWMLPFFNPGLVFRDGCQESTFEALSEWEALANWPPVAHVLEFPAYPNREWHVEDCHVEDFMVYMRKLELWILVPPFTCCVTLHEVVRFAVHKMELIMLISHSCWEVRK